MEATVGSAGCRCLLTDGLVVLFKLAVELQKVAPEVPELGADAVARISVLPVTFCGCCWLSGSGGGLFCCAVGSP